MSNSLPYYGGAGSDLGLVSALPPPDFAAFVKETLGNPYRVSTLTRDEFRALPKDQRQVHKRVSFFTAAAFKFTSGRRVFENASCCNLICLDLDEDADSQRLSQEIMARPGLLNERLYPHAFAAYLTASSTPQVPRLRIVVRAERLPVDTYPKAVSHVADLLGLRSITPESTRAVQPMYLPTIFRNDDPVADHPLIVAVPEGEAVTTANVTRSVSPSANAPEDEEIMTGLEFLRPRVDGLALEDVRSAVESFDPDCNYGEWIEVAAALRHQFRGEEEEAAFQVFHDWSRRGTKYPGEEDVRKKWDSFRSTPRNRAPVTMRTILKRAADFGWSLADTVAKRCYEHTERWLRSPDRSAIELMESGASRIVGTPLVSEIQRGSLIGLLYERLKLHEVKMTRAELKKAVVKLERAAAKAASTAGKPVPDAQMPAWARGICYVAGQNEFFRRHEGRKFKPEVLDNYFAKELMTKEDEARGRPVVQPRDYLLNLLKCPRADDYTYLPNVADPFVVDGVKRLVNLYIPTYPQSNAEQANEAGDLLRIHLAKLIREEEYQRTLIDFFAYHVQCPGEKIRWAVLLQGAEGAGKSYLLEAMRQVLGDEHVRSIQGHLLFEQYNPWMYGSQLVGLEEVRVVGHSRHEIMNKMKPAITNDFITVRDLYTRPFQIKNVTNYLLFTNFQDALAVTDNDRRYFVVFSKLQSREDVLALGESYFTHLFERTKELAGGLRHWLENWAIQETFLPNGHAPRTTYLDQLTRASATPLQAAVRELLDESENLLIQPDLVCYNALASALELRGLRHDINTQVITSIMSDFGYANLGRLRVNGNRHTVFAKRALHLMADRARAVLEERLQNAEILD